MKIFLCLFVLNNKEINSKMDTKKTLEKKIRRVALSKREKLSKIRKRTSTEKKKKIGSK